MLISAVELLKQSVNLYKNNFVIILKYLLLTLIPMVIMTLIILIPTIFSESFYLASLAGWWWLIGLTGAVIAVLTFVLGMWFSFNLMRVIKKLHNGEVVAPIIETTKETEKILWKGIGTSLLTGLYTAGPFAIGALLLVINMVYANPATTVLLLQTMPFVRTTMSVATFLVKFGGIFTFYLGLLLTLYGAVHAIVLSIKLFPALYETVLAKKPINESIKNGLTMTKNRWWAILGRLLLSGVVVWLIYMVASLLLSLILSAMSKIFGAAGGAIINLIYSVLTQFLSLLITPVPFAVAIMLYEELKKLGPTQTEQKI